MNTQYKITVAVNFTDEVGTDGDWSEGTADQTCMEVAREGLIACDFKPDDIDEMMKKYEVVNLNAEEIQEINDRSWKQLVRQWKMSRRNGWTSTAADELMVAEIARRETL